MFDFKSRFSATSYFIDDRIWWAASFFDDLLSIFFTFYDIPITFGKEEFLSISIFG